METPKFGKITISTPNDDGSTNYETKGYWNGKVSTVKIEKEVSVKTTRQTFLSDIITNVKPITSGETGRIEFSVEAKNGQPDMMKVRWTVSNTNYGRQ